MIPNKEQESIIKYFLNDRVEKRIVSVEAPPGTGKTYTAVSTCINYIDFHMKKNTKYNKKALILTFSKNARAQIEKQLDELSTGNSVIKNHIEITNFHSFFQKYVWAYSKYLSLGDRLTIVSPKQRRDLLKENLKFIKYYNGDRYQYSWVDSLMEGEFFPLNGAGNIRPSVKKLLPYEFEIISAIKDMNKNGYIGFSDIAHYMNELISKSPSLLKIIQYKYELIILDEYQDISDLQDKIVQKIIGKENKAIFFSDIKQMIYGWRGASSDRLGKLYETYSGEIHKMDLVTTMRYKDKVDLKKLIEEVRNETYNLDKNFSSENIKYVKMEVDDKNFNNPKSKNKMYAILRYKLKDNLQTLNNKENKSIGILCRNNELVEYLRRYLREEFKIDTKILCNNEEEHNIIGDLIEISGEIDLTLDEFSRYITKIVFASIHNDNIGTIKRSELNSVSFLNYKNARKPILKVMKSIIEESYEDKIYLQGIYNAINAIHNTDLNVNYENMSLLKKVLKHSKIEQEKVIDLFLQHQYLKSYKELRGIFILNIHQSKGREFDYVYLIDRETINKEENLLYVGVSRAKEKLVILDWVVQ